MPPAVEPEDRHEWISFDDPHERRTWVFDVTFLLSRWTCIFGRGCPGTAASGPAPERMIGCCDHGAHFVDDADLADTERAAGLLTDEQWQFKRLGERKGFAFRQTDGSWKTRVVDGACIFLNRPGFAAGPGCALHQAALAAGEPLTAWKPDVCWQAPLRQHDSVDEYGWVTSTIREWKRRDWGPGGEDFHWWCIDAPDAFVSSTPVYEHCREELVAFVGEEVYAMLAAELDARRRRAFLPHPALKRPSWKT